MTPRNEQEERDLSTLKVIEEIEDQVMELAIRRDELGLVRGTDEMCTAAIWALVVVGRLDPDGLPGLDDVRPSGRCAGAWRGRHARVAVVRGLRAGLIDRARVAS